MADSELQKIAAECGFYKRVSAFTPAMFFELLLYCANSTEHKSLEESVSWLQENYGLEIKKQSLDGRFKIAALNFVSAILTKAITKQLNYVFKPDFFDLFNHVRIKDGTRFNVPNKLKLFYKGSGGSVGTSSAGICIQFEYDAKNGQILDLTITEGVRNDATDAKETLASICPGDLVIRDLGYYSLPTLQHIQSIQASFISRLGAKTAVLYPKTKLPVSFEKIVKKMKKNGISRHEIDVLVGKKERMPARLIIEMLPEEIYNKRLKEAAKKNKEKGYNVSQDYKSRCQLNLFITNLKETEFSIQNILASYKLRWQIELMFKNWKSVCKIDKLKPMNYYRFTCILLTKLITIILNTQIIWFLKGYLYKTKRKILSLFKCFKTMNTKIENLIRDIKCKKINGVNNLIDIASLLSNNHYRDKRKNKTSYEDLLDLIIYKSEK